MPENISFKTMLYPAAALLLIASAWMTWRSWQASSSPEVDTGRPGLVLKDIRYTKTSRGRTVWTLSADQAEHDQKAGITKARNIRLVFHDKERGDIVLTADMGEIRSSSQTIRVAGHVRIENRPDNIIMTDSLEYDEKSGLIKTVSPVLAVIDESIIRGRGLIIDTRRRRLQIPSDINAVLDQEEMQAEDP